MPDAVPSEAAKGERVPHARGNNAIFRRPPIQPAGRTLASGDRLRAVLAVGALALACQRPPVGSTVPPEPTRLPVLAPEYGAHPAYPAALGPGDHLDELSLPLADGGRFELANALGAGPVVLAWVGGAEHDGLTTWVRGLDRALDEFDGRGATLVYVRPLGPEATLRWAVELALQTTAVGDPEGELAGALDLLAEAGEPAPSVNLAVVIVGSDGAVLYRKLGGRRPELAELLAVLDGAGEGLRCCPGACVGEPCEQGQ